MILFWETQDFHALPDTGGLLDQAAGLIARMRKANQIYNIFNAWRKASRVANGWSKFQTEQPDAFKLKCAIDRLRENETPWQTQDYE